MTIRAEDYPFEQPQLDRFSLCHGEVSMSFNRPADCIAVLASGSNASPRQLTRKFGSRSKPLFAEAVTLCNLAIVYSAHFASYGSVPATVINYPGSVTRAFVTWLDTNDLEVMHQSEALGVNYDYADGSWIKAADLDSKPLTIDGFYQSRHGGLHLKSKPVRLAESITIGASLPALTQPALLRHLHKCIAPRDDYTTFMTRISRDRDYRSACSLRLKSL